MGGLAAALREGRWLTRERVRLVALAVLAASGLGLAFLVATSDGLNDYQGRPLGTDFSNVYAAGAHVLDGRPEAPFDPAQQFAREQAIFGPQTQFYGWHYPPFFLFVAALLARMPYALALAAWQGATLALYLAAMWAVIAWAASGPSPPGGRRVADDPLWLLVALAFPAVFVNIGHGHNGFLTAALVGGALVLLEGRPQLAGVLFGLVAYKPQFGLLVPLALIAGGHWRAALAAAATVALLVLAATLAFGPDIWAAFLASTRFTRLVVLEAGDTGWHKIQSVFSWVRMWGAPVPAAYTVQGLVTVVVAALLVRLWRGGAPYPLKAAALCVGTLLATPYSLDYDMMVLAPAIAFLAAHGLAVGFAPGEKTALAALWLCPLLARSVAQLALVPLGVLAMLAVFGLIVLKAGALRGRRPNPTAAEQPR